ncbi:large subunit ribosomal protein L37Ae [Enteropsectra breve]|nr:large subunit ribosomal protein L37Ae [Enteropsectra breve]KAI5152780.1 large subunit ribosomal protein L37Ae [Enteropsectra breve]
MSTATKKVKICGKYGTRYGSTLRKRVKTFEISQHATYDCEMCGKKAVKRVCIGIWSCRRCNNKFAGGAYAPSSKTGEEANTVIKNNN